MAKWIIGAVALVAVIAVTAVVAVSCTKSSGGSDKPTAAPTSGAPTSDFASANDTGPVSVITEDPSCAPWIPINNTLADAEGEWVNRDPNIPATLWSPTVQAQYAAAGEAMRNAADQVMQLTKVTTHRVMRELYEQYAAYARAYADRIPTYTPADDQLAMTAVAISTSLTDICQAISYGAAAARAPLVPAGPMPSNIAPVNESSKPSVFLQSYISNCNDWIAATNDFRAATAAWVALDPNIPAGKWSPEQRKANDDVIPIMNTSADRLQQIGEQIPNSVAQDFATLTVVYRRAIAKAIPSYTVADNHLYNATLHLSGILTSACKAEGPS
ncbi:Vmc-like lipoprotein signal peptide domain-containing protein [Mycolicibacterium fluoranthenivorans]|uniref:Uncharacterized protein n=1 Tax=Mycolicibacterium fluoranthenivorans TaxID=258505 RepID=A0A7X5ZFU1_9MYCO|nr:hypothetical protein [Mycolicibacterium fluoranthenivorans]MCV7357568.1 hypothetical protein [Mycolicibacterium fluoranthenivorans]NIH98545.1 hypothetical protein [Mycolicibacterium fluoranthenivorans]